MTQSLLQMSVPTKNKRATLKYIILCYLFYLEFVTVVWTDELTGAVEQDNFLLDKGRLKLKTIQHTFSASLVRISIGKKKYTRGD